jgi:glycosyltransferase involved in cell wall biosynthesis
MRIFTNINITNKPLGGTNSFFRALIRALGQMGFTFVHDIQVKYDVALISTLTNGITIDDLAYIRSRGIPVVHRKTNYIAAGSKEMRKSVDGAVVGDRMQIELEPFVNFSVFQSHYSHQVFLDSGYKAKRYAIIPNAVDPRVFGLYDYPRFFWGQPKRRDFWDGQQAFRFAIVSWSKDMRKGFEYYGAFDRELSSIPNVRIDFIGRLPNDLQFENIRTHPPMTANKIGAFLRRCHGFLAFSEAETCSNALLEAINCGLQVIYLDSGANKEFAGRFGVEFQGSFPSAVTSLMDGYQERLTAAPENPFDVADVADRYDQVLRLVEAD